MKLKICLEKFTSRIPKPCDVIERREVYENFVKIIWTFLMRKRTERRVENEEYIALQREEIVCNVCIEIFPSMNFSWHNLNNLSKVKF